jgi:hypothetical protein
MMYGPAAEFSDWAARMAPLAATAWACWWSRPPSPLRCGAACARRRPGAGRTARPAATEAAH